MDRYSMIAFAVLGAFNLLALMRLDKLESLLNDAETKAKENEEKNRQQKTEQNEKIQELLEEFEAVKSRLRVKKPQR